MDYRFLELRLESRSLNSATDRGWMKALRLNRLERYVVPSAHPGGLGDILPVRRAAAEPAPAALGRPARPGRLDLRDRRKHAGLLGHLGPTPSPARGASSSASASRRWPASRRDRDRVVALRREGDRADAPDAAADPAGLLDSPGHHLVRHRRQAGDLPRVPRGLLPILMNTIHGVRTMTGTSSGPRP